jgi:hypothetical protein
VRPSHGFRVEKVLKTPIFRVTLACIIAGSHFIWQSVAGGRNDLGDRSIFIPPAYTVVLSCPDPHRRHMQMSRKDSNVGGQWLDQRSGVGNADGVNVERSGAGIHYSAFPCCVLKAVV